MMKWQYQPKPVTVEVKGITARPFMKWGDFCRLRKDRGMTIGPTDCLRCSAEFKDDDDVYLVMWSKNGAPQKNRFVCAECANSGRAAVNPDA